MSGTNNNNNNNKTVHPQQFVMNEELEPLTGTAKFRFVSTHFAQQAPYAA